MNKHTGDTLRSIVTSELTNKKKKQHYHTYHIFVFCFFKKKDKNKETQTQHETAGTEEAVTRLWRREEKVQIQDAVKSGLTEMLIAGGGGEGGGGASAARARRQNVLNYGRADNGS